MDKTPPSQQPGLEKDLDDIRPSMSDEAAHDEADRRARIEYLRSLTGPRKPKRSWGKPLLIILLILVIAGGAAYWFLLRKSDKPADNAKNQNQSSQSNDTATQNAQIKHHDSESFGLGFDYPENWQVTDEGNGKITVASPSTKLKTPNGTQDGQVVFAIQKKQTSLPGFKNGNAIAVRSSERIAYVKPTPNQRAETYLSFLSNAGSATVAIDNIYVTGDLGYQKDQAIPQVDIIGGDPLVGISFVKCSGDACSADKSATISVADSTWNDSNVMVKAVKAILTSLTIQ